MNIKSEVDIVKTPWRNSPYYDEAEKWTHLFWDDNSLFREYFDRLDLSNVIEIACGYGRHSERVAPKAGKLTLIDVFDENLQKCRERLAKYNHIAYILGNGFDMTPVADNYATAIFSYDAMVHFSMGIMFSYLSETARVLKPGGMALYHHSNYQGPELAHYGQHPHARNLMNYESYLEHARNVGLRVVDSISMDWGGVQDLDRLTLLAKD